MSVGVSSLATELAQQPGLTEWAARTALRTERQPREAGLRFAFYGRVSTEDHQDPVTSRMRQRDQAAMLVAGRGQIRVGTCPTAGSSRTGLPTGRWSARPTTSRLSR